MYLSTSVQLTTHNKDRVNLEVLRKLAYHNARLYNVGLYNVRQHFFNTGQYLNYNGDWHLAKDNENYALLMTDISQQTLRLVDRDMKSFFKLLKAKNCGKYSFPVRLPHYKDKEGMMPFAVQGRSCRIQKDGKVTIGLTKEFRELYNFSEKKITLTIPKNIRNVPEFHEMRFVPMYGGSEFKVEFVYSSEYQNNPEKVNEIASGYMSIDIGVNNLMACSLFSNGDARQFLIDGKYIKAVNHYYNKTKARLQSEYDKNKSIKGMDTKRFRRLSKSRLNKIDDYFNRCVNVIVKICLENGVKTVVIGYNEGQKQGINIGYVNNQTFVSIPYHRLRKKLSYKCELHGIDCVFQEESYTSKASCLDLDNVPEYNPERTDKPVFTGKRKYRGLYMSGGGVVINADINGSVNILRKYLLKRNGKDVTSDQLRALVNGPCQRCLAFAQAPSFREG